MVHDHVCCITIQNAAHQQLITCFERGISSIQPVGLVAEHSVLCGVIKQCHINTTADDIERCIQAARVSLGPLLLAEGALAA